MFDRFWSWIGRKVDGDQEVPLHNYALKVSAHVTFTDKTEMVIPAVANRDVYRGWLGIKSLTNGDFMFPKEQIKSVRFVDPKTLRETLKTVEVKAVG